MTISEEILKRKYITCNRDPILLALGEHLNIESTGSLENVRQSTRIPLLYNVGVRRVKNQELWQGFQEQGRLAYCLERGSLPDTAIIDPNGLLADSKSYTPPYWDKPLSLKQRRDVNGYIKALQGSSLSLEKQGVCRMDEAAFRKAIGQNGRHSEVVFVVLQKEGDTTILMWSRWAKSVANFLGMVQALARQHPNTLFLIKPHPLTPCKKVTVSDNIRNATALHYKDCLQYCDKVLVVNSGVGLQAMMWGKPTYMVGDSHYRIAGVNKTIATPEDMSLVINDNYRVDREKVLRYIHFLKFVFWSDIDLSNGVKQCKYIKIRMINP